MSKGAHCPQCGSAIGAATPGLPVQSCASCDALLLVKSGSVKKVGESGSVPFDVSPIQLGTTLAVDGLRGEVVGRERWGWEEGSWNEWLLDLPGKEHRWVAEEAGQYMVMAPFDPGRDIARELAALAKLGNNALGEGLQFSDRRFTVADIKTIHCVASEGQLPAAVPVKFPRLSIDLRSDDSEVLTWQSDRNGSGFWIGHYRHLHQLAPAGLRQLEGWARPDFEAMT